VRRREDEVGAQVAKNQQAAVPVAERPADWRPLSVAMIGQKGLPATFGGIEHHVEQIGRRLAQRGHRVTVFCRESYGSVAGGSYQGMRLRMAPTIGTKHLDAIVHSASSTALAMADRSDVVHYHALGPGLVAPAPRYLSRAAVVLTVHGLDQQRAKWGAAARAVLGSAHWMSGRVPDRTVVVSKALQTHYAERFARVADYIPNGVEAPRPASAQHSVSRLGLRPGSYLVFVGRLVPEKAPDLLLRAYRRVPGDAALVIVGDSSFTDDYTDHLKQLAAADPRVRLLGFVYGDQLAEIYRSARVFVQPSVVEGLPLTLLEAASYGVPVVASDIPPHVEVLGAASTPGRRLFTSGDERALAEALSSALIGDESERNGAEQLRTEVLDTYRWEAATTALERLYLDVVRQRRR
jgi:glycosyltransferase involved in cell wall biosynthesis